MGLNLRKLPLGMNFHPFAKFLICSAHLPLQGRYRLSLAFVVCSIKHSRFPKVVERKFCLLADFRLLLCGALWKLCLWLNVVGKDIEINKVQER